VSFVLQIVGQEFGKLYITARGLIGGIRNNRIETSSWRRVCCVAERRDCLAKALPGDGWMWADLAAIAA